MAFNSSSTASGQFSSRGETSRTFVVLLLLFALIGGYLYYTQIAKQNLPVYQAPLSDPEFTKFQSFSLDVSLFDSRKFEELRVFGESPVSRVRGGKANLFQ